MKEAKVTIISFLFPCLCSQKGTEQHSLGLTLDFSTCVGFFENLSAMLKCLGLQVGQDIFFFGLLLPHLNTHLEPMARS